MSEYCTVLVTLLLPRWHYSSNRRSYQTPFSIYDSKMNFVEDYYFIPAEQSFIGHTITESSVLLREIPTINTIKISMKSMSLESDEIYNHQIKSCQQHRNFSTWRWKEQMEQIWTNSPDLLTFHTFCLLWHVSNKTCNPAVRTKATTITTKTEIAFFTASVSQKHSSQSTNFNRTNRHLRNPSKWGLFSFFINCKWT